jgi:hypothetical protein
LPKTSSLYGGKMHDKCKQCSQKLHAECPVCGKLVIVTKGLLIAHDASIVHSGHMTWGSCKGSRSPYIVIDKYKGLV